ncbi:MAG: glycoside hydrolase family 140 protein [Bacteroidia bacterium]
MRYLSLCLQLLLTCLLLAPAGMHAQRLRVSDDRRFLVREDGTVFFYLGDTAWELFHRLTREQADQYLEDRARKGFNVVQAVALAELDGLNTPNPYGHKPLIDNDPTRPNEPYFEHVDYIVNKANSLGIYVGLLPTWGDKFNKKWGVGPEIFTPENARVYGKFIGARYKSNNIIWIMGGDRPIETELQRNIVNAMAEGIRESVGNAHLMTYHIWGEHSSSEPFHHAPWLDFNMIQSGHGVGLDGKNFELVSRDYHLTPVKPTFDGEPRYEDIPVNFRADHGRYTAFDVRQAAYFSVFSGAMGHTYGNNNIWQMYDRDKTPIIDARFPWYEAIHHIGATQMGYVRRLFESRPFLELVPAQDALDPLLTPHMHLIRAAKTQSGSCVMAYTCYGEPIRIRTAALSGTNWVAWWYNPTEGKATKIGEFAQGPETLTFTPPSQGRINDWVLVVDDAARHFPAPGTVKP